MIKITDMPTRESLTEKEKEVMSAIDKYLEKTDSDISTLPEKFNIDFDKLEAGDAETLLRVKELKEYATTI